MAGEWDVGKLIVAGGPAGRSDRISSIRKADRLSFGQHVGSGAEVGEGVGSANIGRRDNRDDRAQIVHARERHGGAGDASFRGRLENAIVIEIVINKTGEAGWVQLAEVVAR